MLYAPNRELTETWINTADPRPTATITPVSPDPRVTPVDSVTVVFSRPVTGLTWRNFNLQRSDDGLSNLITSAQTVSTADGVTWTLGNLGGLTGQDAFYEIYVGGTSIVDADGNPLKGQAGDTWTNRIAEVSPLTVTIADVVPNSRTSPVSSIDFAFSAPVTGFDLSDLVLVRGNNSTTNVLTQLQTLTTADQIHFTLGNLDPVNTEYHSYRLTIRPGGNGIADQFGNPLNNPRGNPISESWTVRVPRVLDIVDVTPDPRSTPVDSITIILKAPRTLSLSSFYLEGINDGLPNLISSSQTLTTSDNITWVLGNLAPITTRGGVYQLRIDGLLEEWTNTSPVSAEQSRVAALDVAWEELNDSANPDLGR